MKKSNHSKKIVKQLKKEYKEDLEKSGIVKQEIRSGEVSHCPLQYITCHLCCHVGDMRQSTEQTCSTFVTQYETTQG